MGAMLKFTRVLLKHGSTTSSSNIKTDYDSGIAYSKMKTLLTKFNSQEDLSMLPSIFLRRVPTMTLLLQQTIQHPVKKIATCLTMYPSIAVQSPNVKVKAYIPSSE